MTPSAPDTPAGLTHATNGTASAIASSLADTSRWFRLMQLAMYPFDTALLIGGSVKVDPEVSDMNDLARLVELCSSPPFMAYPLLNREPLQASATGNYWNDNVATWSDAAGAALVMPKKWMTWFAQYEFRDGLIVAPLKLTLRAGTKSQVSIWNYLIIDRTRGALYVDRLDPDDDEKPGLDAALGAFFGQHLPGFTYRSPETTGGVYRGLVNDTVMAFDAPEFVLYNVWAYWFLHARLCFADLAQEVVYGSLASAAENMPMANAVLNYYGIFSATAVLHAFHDELFLMKYPSKRDLWRFEGAIMDRVWETTTGQIRTSQLNQVIGAAIHDFVNLNDGDDYRAAYRKFTDIDPTYIPKPQNSGGWIPVDQVDETLKALLTGKVLRLGYIEAAPYIFRDATKALVGINIEMMKMILPAINSQYKLLTGEQLTVEWVDACATATDPPCTAPPVEETDKFELLYRGLTQGHYHAAFGGQLMLTGNNTPAGTNPEWAVPTALIFTAVCYTGRDFATLAPDWSKMKTHDRAGFIEYVAGTLLELNDVELTFLSVINPGPSPASTQNLVAAINDARGPNARGCAVWVNATVPQTTTLLQNQTYHFMVGDSIANGYMFASLKPEHSTYLNIAAVDTPSVHYDATVRSNTLLAVAPFTVNAR